MAEQRLVDFIKRALSEGATLEQIKQTLLAKGWAENDVNDAMTLATPGTSTFTPTPPTSVYREPTEKYSYSITNRGQVKEVKWTLTLIMSIFFGSLGVDRFMMGKIGLGILKLITLGGLGIWWLIDLILIATKHKFKGIEWI